MKNKRTKEHFLGLLIFILLCSQAWAARPVNELEKNYPILSAFHPVPDNDKQHFKDVYFRLGWNKKKPYQIAVQFTNQSYDVAKLKFVIKDVSTKKNVIMDKERNTPIGTETLPSISEGKVWSGDIENNKDSFILKIWDKDDDEFESAPLSTIYKK